MYDESTTIQDRVAAEMGWCGDTVFRVETTHHIVDALQANRTGGSNPFDSEVGDRIEIGMCFGAVSQFVLCFTHELWDGRCSTVFIANVTSQPLPFIGSNQGTTSDTTFK